MCQNACVWGYWNIDKAKAIIFCCEKHGSSRDKVTDEESSGSKIAGFLAGLVVGALFFFPPPLVPYLVRGSHQTAGR